MRAGHSSVSKGFVGKSSALVWTVCNLSASADVDKVGIGMGRSPRRVFNSSASPSWTVRV